MIVVIYWIIIVNNCNASWNWYKYLLILIYLWKNSVLKTLMRNRFFLFKFKSELILRIRIVLMIECIALILNFTWIYILRVCSITIFFFYLQFFKRYYIIFNFWIQFFVNYLWVSNIEVFLFQLWKLFRPQKTNNIINIIFRLLRFYSTINCFRIHWFLFENFIIFT